MNFKENNVTKEKRSFKYLETDLFGLIFFTSIVFIGFSPLK